MNHCMDSRFFRPGTFTLTQATSSTETCEAVNGGRDPAPTYPVGRDVRGASHKSQMKCDSGVIKVSEKGS